MNTLPREPLRIFGARLSIWLALIVAVALPMAVRL